MDNQVDVNENKLGLFKRKKKDANNKKLCLFKKRKNAKKGVTFFFLHKNEKDHEIAIHDDDLNND